MPSRNAAHRLTDIVENARAIERYCEGLDLEGLRADPKTRDAVERCLERISEAAAKLGETASDLVPDQPWPQIRALGNRLRHEYDRLRAELIWQIVRNDLPALRGACEAALADLRNTEGMARHDGDEKD